MMALRVGKDPFDYINEVKVEKARHAMKRRLQDYVPNPNSIDKMENIDLKRRLQDYVPNPNSIDKMENIDQKFHLIVFSAEWCGDCVAYIPGLAKALAISKNDMIQARVVDYDNHRDMADEMNVRKIPTIIVYDKNWKEIGRFIESPRKYGTVEEELCAILDSTTNSAKVQPPQSQDSGEKIRQ